MRHRPLRMMHALASAAVILLAVLTTAGADPMIDGRAYSDAFLKGDIDRVWSRMDGQMQGALGSEETLDQLRSTLRRDFGEEAEVLEEEIGEADGYSVYLRTSRWTKAPGPLVMQWTLDGDGNVAGFFVRPKPVAAESRFLDYQTKTELHLPFEGQWYVYWGGRTIDQNYHAADRAQRFALDLVVRKSETTFEGEEGEIAIDPPPGGHDAEFDAWAWKPMRELPELIVPFKRGVYEQVVAAFTHLDGPRGRT